MHRSGATWFPKPVCVEVDFAALRVGHTRVTLDTLIAACANGATAEEIAQQYPSLHVADIYTVIGYYLRHSSEIEAYFHQGQRQRKAIRQQNEARMEFPQEVTQALLQAS